MTTLSTDYILGFTDGEGCLSLHITKRKTSAFGFYLTPSFSLSQNKESKQVLQDIQSFFQYGFLRKERETIKYEVRDLNNLEMTIIPFFKKNLVRTQKAQDFEIFCEICDCLKKKNHLTYLGVVKLIDLAYSMNKNGGNRRQTKSALLLERNNKPKNLR